MISNPADGPVEISSETIVGILPLLSSTDTDTCWSIISILFPHVTENAVLLKFSPPSFHTRSILKC